MRRGQIVTRVDEYRGELYVAYVDNRGRRHTTREPCDYTITYFFIPVVSSTKGEAVAVPVVFWRTCREALHKFDKHARITLEAANVCCYGGATVEPGVVMRVYLRDAVANLHRVFCLRNIHNIDDLLLGVCARWNATPQPIRMKVGRERVVNAVLRTGITRGPSRDTHLLPCTEEVYMDMEWVEGYRVDVVALLSRVTCQPAGEFHSRVTFTTRDPPPAPAVAGSRTESLVVMSCLRVAGAYRNRVLHAWLRQISRGISVEVLRAVYCPHCNRLSAPQLGSQDTGYVASYTSETNLVRDVYGYIRHTDFCFSHGAHYDLSVLLTRARMFGHAIYGRVFQHAGEGGYVCDAHYTSEMPCPTPATTRSPPVANYGHVTTEAALRQLESGKWQQCTVCWPGGPVIACLMRWRRLQLAREAYIANKTNTTGKAKKATDAKRKPCIEKGRLRLSTVAQELGIDITKLNDTVPVDATRLAYCARDALLHYRVADGMSIVSHLVMPWLAGTGYQPQAVAQPESLTSNGTDTHISNEALLEGAIFAMLKLGSVPLERLNSTGAAQQAAGVWHVMPERQRQFGTQLRKLDTGTLENLVVSRHANTSTYLADPFIVQEDVTYERLQAEEAVDSAGGLKQTLASGLYTEHLCTVDISSCYPTMTVAGNIDPSSTGTAGGHSGKMLPLPSVMEHLIKLRSSFEGVKSHKTNLTLLASLAVHAKTMANVFIGLLAASWSKMYYPVTAASVRAHARTMLVNMATQVSTDNGVDVATPVVAMDTDSITFVMPRVVNQATGTVPLSLDECHARVADIICHIKDRCWHAPDGSRPPVDLKLRVERYSVATMATSCSQYMLTTFQDQEAIPSKLQGLSEKCLKPVFKGRLFNSKTNDDKQVLRRALVHMILILAIGATPSDLHRHLALSIEPRLLPAVHDSLRELHQALPGGQLVDKLLGLLTAQCQEYLEKQNISKVMGDTVRVTLEPMHATHKRPSCGTVDAQSIQPVHLPVVLANISTDFSNDY